MFREILVPLDGSDRAERALPYAQELAQLTGATLHLVRVCIPPPAATWAPMPPYVPAGTYDEVLAAEEQEATTYLEAVRHRLRAALHVDVQHLIGSPGTTLVSYEREAQIDLVVLSSHGRGGLARLALGSVAAELVHNGSAPILLVRGDGTPSPLHRIVVPLDGSPLAEAALPLVHTLAGAVAQEVTLLRVIGAPTERPEAERYLAAVCQGLRQEQVTVTPLVAQGDPAQVILDVAGVERAVVMATHGRSGLSRWALGSVADRVSRQAGTAVLLLRAETRATELADQTPAHAATAH